MGIQDGWSHCEKPPITQSRNRILSIVSSTQGSQTTNYNHQNELAEPQSPAPVMGIPDVWMSFRRCKIIYSATNTIQTLC